MIYIPCDPENHYYYKNDPRGSWLIPNFPIEIPTDKIRNRPHDKMEEQKGYADDE